MMLSDIQQVVKPEVWDKLKDGISGYHFNVSIDFFIEGIENHYDHFWVRLRDGRLVSVPRPQDYTQFCESLLKVWCEYMSDLKQGENFETDINEDEHWYCRGCGKEFSHEMNFRKDGYGRRVCPYCDSRKLDKVSGQLDSFYD